MTRRLLAGIILFALIIGWATCRGLADTGTDYDGNRLIVTEPLQASDRDAQFGIYNLGPEMGVLAERGSEAHAWLDRNRGKRLVVVFAVADQQDDPSQ